LVRAVFAKSNIIYQVAASRYQKKFDVVSVSWSCLSRSHLIIQAIEKTTHLQSECDKPLDSFAWQFNCTCDNS